MTLMDNFWIKAVIVLIVAVAIILGIKHFKGPKPGQPASQEKTIGDQFREDDQRLRAEPNIMPQTGTEQANAPLPAVKFRELEEEEQAGAEALFELTVASRKMARLPGVTYGQMVDYCRQIIQKYPGSEFEYKARRMLGEVPREQWDRYHITEQEINPTK